MCHLAVCRTQHRPHMFHSLAASAAASPQHHLRLLQPETSAATTPCRLQPLLQRLSPVCLMRPLRPRPKAQLPSMSTALSRNTPASSHRHLPTRPRPLRTLSAPIPSHPRHPSACLDRLRAPLTGSAPRSGHSTGFSLSSLDQQLDVHHPGLACCATSDFDLCTVFCLSLSSTQPSEPRSSVRHCSPRPK